jgi:hydrogenase/urease accessory protein HupE
VIHFPRKNAVRAVVAAVAVVFSQAANAHLVSTELGPLYDGAAHPLVSPQDLLTILGLAILAAHGGAISGRRLIVSLTLAWATGVCIGFAAVHGPLEFPVAAAAVILILGILGVSRLRIPSGVLVSASTFLGLARGVMNGSAARNADGQWLSVLGIALGIFVLCTLLTGGGKWLENRRFAVALRVIGSWIAAIGLLMLGWELRG